MTAMEALERFIVSGRIFDVVLVVLAAEVAWLAWRRRNGDRSVLAPLVANAGAGAALVLAFKAILADSPGSWLWAGVALLAALLCHLADLTFRHARTPAPPTAGDPEPKPTARTAGKGTRNP